MTEKKYIIEYLGGCKGDMLTGLLNREDLSINDLRKVNRESLITLKDISDPNPKPSMVYFKEKIRSLEDKFTTSHPMFYLTADHFDVLDQNHIKIIKISFDKIYFPTVNIERIFKNLKSRLHRLDKRWNLQKSDDFYRVDYDLIEKNIPITNSNRAEQLHHVLKNGSGFLRENLFNLSKFDQNKIIWRYHDLYVETKLTGEFLQDIDVDLYMSTLNKSWLPEEIHVFDEIWKPKEYGYRSF